MEFVGRGEWLFIAGVCRLWYYLYKIIETENRTTKRAALESVGRLELSQCAGLCLGGKMVGRYAGDSAVVLRSRELGMRWDRAVACGAAMAGRLPLLKQLIVEHECPVDPDYITQAAMMAPTPLVLAWLRTHLYSDGWHEHTLFLSAIRNQLSTVQWARDEGCLWNWHPGCCRKVRYSEHANTTDTFDWLHAQEGFPCNCA